MRTLQVRDFAAFFVQTLSVSLSETRVGVIVYNNAITAQIQLNQYADAMSLADAIRRIAYTSALTNTGL